MPSERIVSLRARDGLRLAAAAVAPDEVPGRAVVLVHGTRDTFVPMELTRAALPRFLAEHRLVDIEGSLHGFAVRDDPRYLTPEPGMAGLRDWRGGGLDHRGLASRACLSARAALAGCRLRDGQPGGAGIAS
jgi:hypothetical protein